MNKLGCLYQYAVPTYCEDYLTVKAISLCNMDLKFLSRKEALVFITSFTSVNLKFVCCGHQLQGKENCYKDYLILLEKLVFHWPEPFNFKKVFRPQA